MGLTSAHWGVYEFAVKNGRITRNEAICRGPRSIADRPSIIDLLDDPMRIKAPAVRESWLNGGREAAPEKRGSDPFVIIGWDEAERLVAAELNRVRTTYGNQAIYAGSYGWASAGRFHHAQSQVHRF